MLNFSISQFLLSGALISLPNDRVLVAWGDAKKEVKPSSENPYFYVNDFFLGATHPWIHYEFWAFLERESFLALLPKSFSLSACEWSPIDEINFKQQFFSLMQEIQSGNLFKGVPYVFSTCSRKIDSSSLLFFLSSALSYLRSSSGFIYGYWEKSRGFLGVTPELLFSYDFNDQNLLDSVALAGSSLPGGQEHSLFLEKEQKEHAYVIQGIAEQLKEVGQVIVETQKIVRLPSISHLMTPLKIVLKENFCFENIVHCLHPTPALGAFPKERGEIWLKKTNRLLERKSFGAPFGLYFPKEKTAVCYVSIRNIQWNAMHQMRIGAGCGVIADSCYEKEKKELELKIETVKKIIGLSQ